MILKQARGYLALQDKNYANAIEYFNESDRIPANVSRYGQLNLPQQARKMFYLGLCHAKLGDKAAANKFWKAVLETKILPRFEPSEKFMMACTHFFHVFALKALKRYAEAEICMQLIVIVRMGFPTSG